MAKVLSFSKDPQPEYLHVGQTFENAYIRVHRWGSAVQVWDLANAGKRGKRVSHFHLYDTDRINNVKVESNFYKFLFGVFPLSYAQARQWAQVIARDASQRGEHSPVFEEHEARGVDVVPAGMGTLEFDNAKCNALVKMNEFLICDKIDQNNLPAYASRGCKKTQLKKFYLWVRDHQNEVKNLSFREWQNLIQKHGMIGHFWCRMD